MSYRNDQSKKSSTAFDQASTLVTVVELSRNSWLVAGVVPGIDRHPLKKLAADENGLLALLHRWQQQAVKAGHEIKRVVVAFEAGRDGFWLARWLRARGMSPCTSGPAGASLCAAPGHRRAPRETIILATWFPAWHGCRGRLSMEERDECPVK
jgi:transposase